ncbi:MAG: hypothetical protein O9264_00175 [Leptospira sp.]|nr:hypothetical protein [Leptospira sp.]
MNLKKFLGIPFFLLGVALVSYYSIKAWEIFLTQCPNHDFLSWDENIRLSTVLDQSVDLRDGNYWNGILPFFESPTWPPLRSFTTFLSLYIPTDWPITYRDSFQGLFFLILLFPTLYVVITKVTHSHFWGSVFAFFTFVMCIQTSEIPVYSLTSMLETQSMFFLLLCGYTLFRLYDEDNAGEISRTSKYLVTLSLFGFFFTKYPYGILFFMACIFYEIFRSTEKYKQVGLYLYKDYAKGFRLIYLIFVIAMILSLPILRVVTNINLNQRTFKTFMYYISLVLFIDFSIYIYRNREKVLQVFPKTLSVLWVYAIFPAFFWLFANPDRVNALIDAQLIVNQYTRSFFLTLWTEPGIDPKVPGIFDFVWGFRLLFVLAVVSIFYFLIRKHESFASKRKDPLLAATIVIFLELLILELTTGNKQPRHVLQFVPSIGFLCSVWILRFAQFAEYRYQKNIAYSIILISMILLGWNLFDKQGLLTDSFFTEKTFCYRGKNAGDFQPAREIAEQIDPTKRYILLNAFHDTAKYETRGRVIASDFDLAMKLKTFKLGAVRNDHRFRWKDWSSFDSILLLSDTCPDTFIEEKFEARSKLLNAKSSLISTYRESSGIACLQEYQILK